MKKLYTLLFLLTFFLPNTRGQESTPPDKLTYGVYLYPIREDNYYQPQQLGFNTVVQYVTPGNIDSLMLFENSIADNGDWQHEYIRHYSEGYYSKWEAEENTDTSGGLIAGVKHAFGRQDGDYWIVDEEDEPGEKFIYGPHYNQDKQYRYRWYITEPLTYNVNFRIKLLESSEALPVCSLKVVYNYKAGETIYEEVFVAVQVNTSQLSTNSFTDITLSYTYPQDYYINNIIERYIDEQADYIDTDMGTGIQFIVDWLGGPRIAVDYIEVYDQIIWGEYIDEPVDVIAKITNFANSFPSLTNLKYWHSLDSPLTFDSYEPYRVIDSILASINAKPLITNFHPGWNGERNGRKTIQMWKDIAQPKELSLIYLPMWYEHTPNPHENLEWLFGDLLRGRFQEAHLAIPDYIFLAPVMDWWNGPNQPKYYRKPVGSELRAMIMLALSHGAKGISFMHYYSYEGDSSGVIYLRCDGLVGLPETGFEESTLWHYIKDNISPRITGTLGNTLAKLDYTGDYIDFFGGTEGLLHTEDYLSIVQGGAQQVSYHAGLLESKTDNDNKFFLVLNKLTDPTKDRLCNMYINYNNVLPANYINWRVRNIEGGIDTTFSSSTYLQFSDSLKAGDGKLYQVAPVVKYGGTLAYNDTIKTGSIELTDNMTIQDGVNLVINTNYTAKDTITLEGTGFITGDGYFYLSRNGAVIINSWERSLFKSKSGNNPKIIWGKYPGGNPDYYKIYYRLNQGAWNFLTQVDSTAREFTDTTFDISSTNGSIVQKEYAVTAWLSDSETGFSNMVTYRTLNFWSVTTSTVNGWQTLSVPVIVEDFTKTTVWSTANSAAYSYCGSGGYVQEDTLENGAGYFISFSSSQEVSYMGGKLKQFEVPVCAGWNIIGSISEKVPINSNVCLHPAENRFESLKYIYQNGYIQVDSIYPGMGHWVKVSMTGSVEVNENAILCDYGTFVAEEELDHFIIVDSEEKRQDLYVANLSLNPSLEGVDLSMPPPFPGAAFDARFEAGEYIKAVIPDSNAVELVINIETEAYPVTVSWELNPENGIEYSISTQGLGKMGSNTMTLTEGKLRMNAFVSDMSKIELPTIYSLEPNYPNPFNPTTVIKYSIPEASEVTLSVYDILGREVATLVNEKKEPGYYQVTFNAENLASGIYIYRLVTKNYTKSQKMLLVK